MSEVIDAHNLGIAGGHIIEAAMQGDIDQLKAENAKLQNDADLLRAMLSQVQTEKRCYMAENAKLREYVTKLEAANLDVTARLTDYIGQYDPTDAFVAEVKADNAKLRELVRWMYERMDESCAVQYPYAPAPISYDRLMQALARARDLGVEVD